MKKNNNQPPKLLYGLYRFSTIVLNEQTNRKKEFVRIVRIIQVNFPKEWISYKLYCKQFIFNDPQATALMRKIAYLFSAISIRINLEGNLILIENDKELQTKWEDTKIELYKNHKGEVFERYVQTVDETLYNQEKLLKYISNNKMFGLFLKHLTFFETKNIKAFTLNEINTRKIYFKETNEKQTEKYIYQNDDLREVFLMQNNEQHEIVWIG